MKDQLKALGAWALERSQEASTYVGGAMVAASVLGHNVDDHTLQVVTWVGQFVGAGMIAATTKRPS